MKTVRMGLMKEKLFIGCFLATFCFFAATANACPHTVYVYSPSISPSTTIYMGQTVTVTRSTASYCDTCYISYYSWSATGANPSSGTGTSFSCTYSTAGTKTITLTAHCGAGYTRSTSVQITVLPVVTAPVVENRQPDVEEDNGVILKGKVTSTGGADPDVKFYYDTTDHGTGSWPNEIGPDPAGTKAGDFSSQKRTGLNEGKLYYFRAYAWNSGGTDWDDHTTHSVTYPIKFITAPGQAGVVAPTNSAILNSTSVTLQWQAGTSDTTPEHRVYFGTSYSEVNAANTGTSGIYKGQQAGTSYLVTETLSRGQSYYWRIDEVIEDTYNDAVKRVRKGQIWMFAVATIIDEDNDGMEDAWEQQHNVSDPAGDPDNDGLTNLEEFQHGTDPNDDDTDNDGILDGDELNTATGSSYITDPLNPDSDGDGITDGWEISYGLDPTAANSGTLLFGIPALWWFEQDIEPSQANADADTDSEGLTNYAEYTHGTDPYNPDTDGDGVDDGWEVTYASNFYVAEVQEALNPTLYDAYTKAVGQIPAIWWYNWWTYCSESAVAMQTYFVPSAVNAAEDDDLDNDGFSNLVEYCNGTNPTEDNSNDYWTESVYDEAGNMESEKQFVYDPDTHAETCIAETVHDYDDLGRGWRTRQKSNPDGTIDNSNDAITLTEFNVDGSVARTIKKGIDSTNPDAVDTTTPTKDVITAYTYDSLGRQYTVTDAMGEITTYDYSATTGLLESITLPAKSGDTRMISYYYDNVDRLCMTVNPEGDYETKSYDSMGHVLTSFFYDTVGQIDPLTSSESDDIPVTQRRMLYDNLGTLILDAAMKTASSSSTEDEWIDRLTYYVIDYDSPNKSQKKIIYSGVGEIVDETQAESDIAADASGRGLPTLIQKGYATDDSGQPTVRQFMEYNAAGQRILQTTAHYTSRDATTAEVVVASEIQYDSYGRLAASIQLGDLATPADDLTATYSYRGSQKMEQVDPEGIHTVFTYNAFGQMEVKTEDATGLARVTEYEYDRLGNLKTLVANDGTSDQTTAYLYDKGGKVTQITYPDNDMITYVYEDPAAGGRPTQRIDQRDITTVYTYNKLGNLLQKQDDETSPTTVEEYTYDPRGLMLTAEKTVNSSPISFTQMQYNGLGYMTQSSQSIKGGTAKVVSYDRDQLGQMTRLTIPTATPVVLDYTYTSLGQVDTITRDTMAQLVNYSYAGSMVTGRAYPAANVTFTPQFDDFGRITRHTTVNSSNIGVDFAYAYDANGNITSQTYHHRTSTPANGFTYDDLNRLTVADYLAGLTGAETFNYDLLGNRQTVTDSRTSESFSYVHNEVNEYETVTHNGTPATLLHDAAGNLTRDHRGYLYEYDMENRLTTVRRSDTTLVATFEYDALGRRIEKVDAIAGTTTRYYYDDQRVALETLVSGETEAERHFYVFGNYIDEVLVMGFKLSSSWFNLYYGHDHLYSPVVFYGPSGVVLERYEYDAYGKVQVMAPDFSSRTKSLYDNPYTFTGRELDSLDNNTLHQMYYRARSYDPDTGRFMQRDPLSMNHAGGALNRFTILKQYTDGMSLYEYVKSDPIVKLDPTGLICFGCSLPPGTFPPAEKVPNGYPITGWVCAFYYFLYASGGETQYTQEMMDSFWELSCVNDAFYSESMSALKMIQTSARCENVGSFSWKYNHRCSNGPRRLLEDFNTCVGVGGFDLEIKTDCVWACGKKNVNACASCRCECGYACNVKVTFRDNYNFWGDNNCMLMWWQLFGHSYDVSGSQNFSFQGKFFK